MAKFTPTEILSTYASIAALNANFDKIAELFEQAVFRDGTSPNHMTTDLDMNHRKITNVGTPVNNSDAVRLSDLAGIITADGSDLAILETDIGASLLGYGETTVASIFDNDIWASSYGIVGDGTTDNLTALNTVIAAAIATKRRIRFPTGKINFSAPLTLPDQTCTLSLIGVGHSGSFDGGLNNDPTIPTGTVLNYTGTSGNAFPWTITGSHTVYLNIVDVMLRRNSGAGTGTGSGLVLTAAGTTMAFKVLMDNFVSLSFPSHGIHFDGNVFESHMHYCRSSQHGGSAFKTTANTGGFTGEITFVGGLYNWSNIGIDIAGSGCYNFFGVTHSYNITNNFKATGTVPHIFGCMSEVSTNHTIGGDQILLTSSNQPSLIGVMMSARTSGTGTGIKLVSCTAGTINGYTTNSSVTGVGYKDLDLSGSTLCTFKDVVNNDGIDRISLGTNSIHRGDVGPLPRTAVGQQSTEISVTSTASQSFNTILYNDFNVNVTVTATLNIGQATQCAEGSFIKGQMMYVTIFNNTAGAITINWHSTFLMPTLTAPATGKRVSGAFKFNNAISKWVQVGAFTGDM